MKGLAEYIWMDGAEPTSKLRSKARVINVKGNEASLANFPKWSFDGSSTYQAKGHSSDLVLVPVSFVHDPLRGDGCYLVMCEVMEADGVTPHATNTRAKLRQVLDAGAAAHDPWFGFEQEYTLFEGLKPLGWPEGGYPAPQGPFYCGVGADEVFGRELIEAHAAVCLEAGVMLYGINAEVMPGQWEFQIGHRGFEGESGDPLTVADHLWFARWLLYRIGEDFGITATLDPKPVRGDWNGAGNHTNFSTKEMRTPGKGAAESERIIKNLAAKHDEHIAVYGADLDRRLTGHHETCHITEFRHGVADRGASIRVPPDMATKGCGYLEDRRPGANCDPYIVSARILATICDIEM